MLGRRVAASAEMDDGEKLSSLGWVEYLSLYELADHPLQEQGQLDSLARIIHEAYVSAELARGTALGAWDSLQHWPEVDEFFRNENRYLTDQLPVKLRHRLILSGPRGAQAAAVLEDAELEAMSVAEHQRWWANRLVLGWQYDPQRDDGTRRHPNMVP